MNRDLLAAHAYLHEATTRWPQAAANLNGAPTPSSAGIHDGGCQSGYPTGHTGTSRLEDLTRDYPPDPARQALHAIHHSLATINQLALELLDLDPWPDRTLTTSGQLHRARRRVELCTQLELTDLASPDCQTIHHHAGQLRQTIVDWAWTTNTPNNPERCRDCWTIHWHTDVYRNGLCRWCYDYHHTYRRRPTRHLLELRRDGIRITTRHITQAQGRTA